MNRTFLTKRLVSLDIFTKQAQSKGMFLDIPFIFLLTKNQKFVTTFQNQFSTTIKIWGLHIF